MRGLCGLFGLLLGCESGAAAAPSVTVERGDLLTGVDVTGSLRAVESDRLGPPAIPDMWSFKIAMMAPEGEQIAAGAPALAFDTSELARKRDEKQAERDAAATQLELKQAAIQVARQDEQLAIAEAEAELRKARVKAEAPTEITGVIEIEKARIDRSLAEQKLSHLRAKAKAATRRDAAELAGWRSKRDRAQARLEQIEQAIELMVVSAPRTGTVIYETDWNGKKKKVGEDAWRAQTLVEVASLTKMEADAEVDEVDIAKVRKDQSVSLRLNAQPDVEVRGRVRRVAETVTRASPKTPLKVGHLDVELLDPGELRLRPGMGFRGRIETERFTDVLLIPLDAVEVAPGGPVVHRQGVTGVEVVPVELGARDADRVIVRSGLNEGDELVTAPTGAS